MAYIVFMLFNLNKFGVSTIIPNCFIHNTAHTHPAPSASHTHTQERSPSQMNRCSESAHGNRKLTLASFDESFAMPHRTPCTYLLPPSDYFIISYSCTFVLRMNILARFLVKSGKCLHCAHKFFFSSRFQNLSSFHAESFSYARRRWSMALQILHIRWR